MVQSPFRLGALALATAFCAAQEPKFVAYPDRDILSPFRSPSDVYAPPDALFHQLHIMQALADRPDLHKDFDRDGREVVDDARWHGARIEAERIGIDAAYLAQIMRLHKNAGERATALYAAFFCTNRDHVFNLISHIPGEPERKTREAAMPRAIAYLRANLGRKFGDLPPEEKAAIATSMPQIGSPAAKAAGIVRAPVDQDHLHDVRLVPFYQLLDLAEPIDQAQGLWFLKEVFLIRLDKALLTLEPALPRIRQLIASKDDAVRDQAIGLMQAVGGKDLRKPPVDDPAALPLWVDEASKALFPPIRNLNDAIVQLHPSPERDAVVAAGIKALEDSSIGDAFVGQNKAGQYVRGYRLVTVPDVLKPLAIPAGAVVTTVNGVGVSNAKTLLNTLREQLARKVYPNVLFVEYVRGEETHAVEYRVM